jgi:hypothetical protein
LGTAKSNLPSKLRFSSVSPFEVLVIVHAIVACDGGIDSLVYQIHSVCDLESGVAQDGIMERVQPYGGVAAIKTSEKEFCRFNNSNEEYKDFHTVLSPKALLQYDCR